MSYRLSFIKILHPSPPPCQLNGGPLKLNSHMSEYEHFGECRIQIRFCVKVDCHMKKRFDALVFVLLLVYICERSYHSITKIHCTCKVTSVYYICQSLVKFYHLNIFTPVKHMLYLSNHGSNIELITRPEIREFTFTSKYLNTDSTQQIHK